MMAPLSLSLQLLPLMLFCSLRLCCAEPPPMSQSYEPSYRMRTIVHFGLLHVAFPRIYLQDEGPSY